MGLLSVALILLIAGIHLDGGMCHNRHKTAVTPKNHRAVSIIIQLPEEIAKYTTCETGKSPVLEQHRNGRFTLYCSNKLQPRQSRRTMEVISTLLCYLCEPQKRNETKRCRKSGKTSKNPFSKGRRFFFVHDIISDFTNFHKSIFCPKMCGNEKPTQQCPSKDTDKDKDDNKNDKETDSDESKDKSEEGDGNKDKNKDTSSGDGNKDKNKDDSSSGDGNTDKNKDDTSSGDDNKDKNKDDTSSGDGNKDKNKGKDKDKGNGNNKPDGSPEKVDKEKDNKNKENNEGKDKNDQSKNKNDDEKDDAGNHKKDKNTETQTMTNINLNSTVNGSYNENQSGNKHNRRAVEVWVIPKDNGHKVRIWNFAKAKGKNGNGRKIEETDETSMSKLNRKNRNKGDKDNSGKRGRIQKKGHFGNEKGKNASNRKIFQKAERKRWSKLTPKSLKKAVKNNQKRHGKKMDLSRKIRYVNNY